MGTTIFAARVLESWTAWMGDSLDSRQRDAAIDSLSHFSIASNYRASTCALCASLAGLLWRVLLKHEGTYVGGSSVN